MISRDVYTFSRIYKMFLFDFYEISKLYWDIFNEFTFLKDTVVPVKKSRHEKYYFLVSFFKSGHTPHF